MRKIVYVMPDLIPGGAERIVLNLLKNLPIDKFESEIVLLNHTNHTFSTQIPDSIKIYNLNLRKFRLLILKPFVFFKIIKKSKPDIVVSAFGELNSIVILFSLFFPKIKFIARETSIPSLRYDSFFMKKFNYIFYRFYDKIIVQSDAMLNDLVQNFGLKKSKLIKINNLVDTVFIEKNLRNNKVSKSKSVDITSILYVGSLSEHKGIIRIIHYFNKICNINNNITLTIIGEGPYRDNVKSEIINSPFRSNIILKSFEILPYTSMNNADFLIIASDYEGFPNVGLEANFCGIPVLVSNTTKGGAHELITNNLNGLIIDMNSTDTSFLNTKFDSKIIRDHIIKNYSADVVIHEYIMLFNDLAEK